MVIVICWFVRSMSVAHCRGGVWEERTSRSDTGPIRKSSLVTTITIQNTIVERFIITIARVTEESTAC